MTKIRHAATFWLLGVLFCISSNFPQGIGSLTGIQLSGNTLQLFSGADKIIFRVCTTNVLMVDYCPNGIESPDTLVIGNTSWNPTQFSIDTTADPIKINTPKYSVEISRNPIRFKAFDSTGQLLCSEPATGGLSASGITLNTSGGNFYGFHNKKSGGLRVTSGGTVAAGSQGEAGAPFIWTTKGWGLLADMENGYLDYNTTAVTLSNGNSGTGSVSWAPGNATANDTISIAVNSTKTGKLHWGVNYTGHTWISPDSSYWPKGSTLYSDKVAVETPMVTSGAGKLTLSLGPFNHPKQSVASLAFVIHYDDNSWDNMNGNDYHISYGTPADTTRKNDFEMYLIFGSPVDIISGATDISGKPPLFPKASMGFLNSQWGIDQTELLSMVSTYRTKGIPIDAYILDFDWMDWGADNYGEFRFGPKFPLAGGGTLRDTLLKNGVKLYGIRKPRVHTYTVEGQYAKAQNFFVDYVTDYFSGKQVGRLNFYRPDVRQWFYSSFVNQGHAYSDGMIGYWNDEADEYGNSFNFLQMQRANYEGQRAYNNRRVWSINRNFFLGAQRYAYGHWSGDINTGFSSMAEQAPFMLTSILLGSSWWGMDIGGFNGHPSNDNYYRWVQFGAFVPIFRVHGTLNEKREPWYYGTEAEQIATQFIKLRYKLLPYIYTAAWQNHQTGLSIARPLVMMYPGDQSVTDLTDEWLFGDNMLVKPVLTQNASSVSVYLPTGKWVDYWNGKTYSGPISMTYPVTDATIPLFVKAGAVLPTVFPGQYSNDSLAQGILVFSCYPGESGNSFVYEDDGDSYDYEKGTYSVTPFSQVQSGSSLVLSISPRTGSYKPASRDYMADFCFIKSKPDSVYIDKAKAAESAAANPLPIPLTGWLYDATNQKCYVRLYDDARAHTITVYGNRLSAIDKLGATELSFLLQQNYPNPFNPATTISYQIPATGFVSLKIYDVLGREVRTLVNEIQNAGTHQVQFDASNLPSGMYIYTLCAGTQHLTKKMLLIK